MTCDIQHDATSGRFTTTVDGQRGYVEYQRGDGTLVLTHTVVPAAIGGRGIAGELVKATLDFARSQGLKVVPQCSYAAGWIDKHPDYGDLLA